MGRIMLGCGCPIADAVDSMADECDEPWADWSEDEVVLEKDAYCCECNEDLTKGTRAVVTSAYPADEDGEANYDGEPWEETTCVPCYHIRLSLYCGSTVLGQLRELIGSEMGFDYITGEDTWEIEDEDQFVLDLKAEHERRERLLREKAERELQQRFLRSSAMQLHPPWWCS